jgi:SPP1 gp7 family putative phage head morphogenesis protein
LISLFSGQEKKVLAKVTTSTNIDDMLFNRADENKEFIDATNPVYEDILQTQGDEVLAELGMSFNFNLLNPLVVNWLGEKEFLFADRVNETTLKQLRNQLLDGVREGESIESLRKRIQKVFDGTVRGAVYRSRMIARTEVIGSFNYGSLSAYDQSQVVHKKKWLTALDERVRDTHRAANGQERTLNEPFDVGGYPLQYPGDGKNGPAQEVIQCRCTLLPILD